MCFLFFFFTCLYFHFFRVLFCFFLEQKLLVLTQSCLPVSPSCLRLSTSCLRNVYFEMNTPETVFSSFPSGGWIVLFYPQTCSSSGIYSCGWCEVGLEVCIPTHRCSVFPVLFTLNQVFVGALLGSLLCPVGHFVLAQVLSVLDHENDFDRDYPDPSAGWARLCSVESPPQPCQHDRTRYLLEFPLRVFCVYIGLIGDFIGYIGAAALRDS